MKVTYYNLADTELKARIESDFGNSSGTYILHLYENGLPKVLDRAFGKDLQGILYIGCTEKALYERVNSLATAVISNAGHSLREPNVVGHKTLSKKFYRIRTRVDVDDLIVEVRDCAESPKKDESLLLEQYVKDFGELPPLNGNYGAYVDWSIFSDLLPDN